MTVYVVVDNEVHNPEGYKKYLALITPTVAQFGGTYVVRAGKIHLVDSDWKPDRLVIMAFPTAEQAMAWAEVQRMSRQPAIANSAYFSQSSTKPVTET